MKYRLDGDKILKDERTNYLRMRGEISSFMESGDFREYASLECNNV